MLSSNRSSGFGFIAPLLVLMVVAFNAPIVYMLGLAFWEKGRGFTLEHYEGLVEAPVYLRVLGNTMRISLIATLANVAIGYPLAHWMRGLRRSRALVAIALVVLPFWVIDPGAHLRLDRRAGQRRPGEPRRCNGLGLTDAPVSFLYNELGVTIGMANVLLPFLVLPLFAAMIRIDDRLLQAAASLGAPPRTIFWKVYFPLTLPALAAGTLLVFILCLGFYVTPAILGGGRVPMISNLLDTLINQIPRWEQASAISTILLIVTLLIFAAYRRLDRKASA